MINENKLMTKIQLLERIELLESDLKNEVMMGSELKERLEKLENFFSGKVKNPIYEAIEIHIENFNKRIEKLNDRVECLEKHIISLKDHIKRYHELILGTCPIDLEKTIRSNMKDKTPHKCPVCEGNCMRPNPLVVIKNEKMPINLDCIVCEGKGIVWG